jgi:hypothetical protein
MNAEKQKTAQDKKQEDANAGRKHYSTFNPTIFFIKVIVALATVYISIAVGYAAFLPYDYDRGFDNFAHTAVTSIKQPYMDIISYGKISHFYDWKEISSESIDPLTSTTDIRSSQQQRQDYDSNWSQILYNLRPSNEAVVLTPENYNGTWSLIKCSASRPGTDEKICLESNITHRGSIRYSIDGESEVFGIASNGNYIALTASEYINANEKRTLLLL